MKVPNCRRPRSQDPTTSLRPERTASAQDAVCPVFQADPVMEVASRRPADDAGAHLPLRGDGVSAQHDGMPPCAGHLSLKPGPRSRVAGLPVHGWRLALTRERRNRPSCRPRGTDRTLRPSDGSFEWGSPPLAAENRSPQSPQPSKHSWSPRLLAQACCALAKRDGQTGGRPPGNPWDPTTRVRNHSMTVRRERSHRCTRRRADLRRKRQALTGHCS